MSYPLCLPVQTRNSPSPRQLACLLRQRVVLDSSIMSPGRSSVESLPVLETLCTTMPPPYCYDYPRPSVTVDMVVFTLQADEIHVLMIRRKHDPFEGYWAIPGGFLDLDESIPNAALRELREETGLSQVEQMAPIGVFGAPDRDPRGRVISLAHAAVVRADSAQVAGSDDAAEAAWFEPNAIDRFAFDHKDVLATALHWLVFQVQAGPVGLALLPEVFTMGDVKRLHHAIGGSPQAPSAWRKRLERSGLIAPVPDRKGRYRAVSTAAEILR